MPEKSVCPLSKEAEVPEGEYKQCSHGMCLNHNPEWVSTTTVLLMEVPFASRLHQVWYSASNELPFTVNCCESIMSRFVEVSEKRCKKCQRAGYDVRRYILRACAAAIQKRQPKEVIATSGRL